MSPCITIRIIISGDLHLAAQWHLRLAAQSAVLDWVNLVQCRHDYDYDYDECVRNREWYKVKRRWKSHHQ